MWPPDGWYVPNVTEKGGWLSVNHLNSTADLEAELIQVAAVAHAMVCVLRNGDTSIHEHSWGEVSHEIVLERLRQEEKWGEQSHAPIEWWGILSEELLEAALEAVRNILTNYNWPFRQKQVYESER